jgi:hypothetical protein
MRFFAGAILMVLAAPGAFAQTSPAPITPEAKYNPAENTIDVTWTRCTGVDPAGCPATYAIYRTPPATASTVNPTTLEVLTGLAIDTAVITWRDPSTQPGGSYSYLVCTGTQKLAKQTNCTAAGAAAVPSPPPPPSQGPDCDNPDGYPCNSAFSPPTNVQATAYLDAVMLQWVNTANGWHPPVVQINLGESDGTFQDVLATLPATGTVLPTRYSASAGGGPGTLVPHEATQLQVCEGIGYIFMPVQMQTNCAVSNTVEVAGLDPVLAVTSAGVNSANLTVIVDNPINLTAIDVTRQESDDPARQGGTLGNGLQGCLLPSPVPGATPRCVNSQVLHLSVSHATPDATGSLVKTFQLGPDTGLKPGVSYYYTATATWFGSLQQSSEVVTFKDSLGLVALHGQSVAKQSPYIGKLQPSGAGKDGATGVTAANSAKTSATVARQSTLVAPVAVLATHLARPVAGSSSDLLSRANFYCATNRPAVCANVLFMTLIRAQQTGDAATSKTATQELQARGQRYSLP